MLRILSVPFLSLSLIACGGSDGASEPQDTPDTTVPIVNIIGDQSLTIGFGEIYEDAGATAVDDVDGNVSVTSEGSVNTSQIGEYEITYSATDSSGNTGYATRVVYVEDIMPPTIKLYGDAEIRLSFNEPYIENGATALDDVDGEIDVTIEGSVDNTSLGEYLLTYTATDSAGNTSSITRTVTIIDTAAPVITLFGEPSLTHTFLTEYIDMGAEALDDVDGEVDITLEGQVDYSTIGEYTLTYIAVDSSGNKSTKNRKVTVKDETAPIITLNGAMNIELPLNSAYIEEGATALDDLDGTVEVVIEGEVNTSQIGEYLIKYEATDNAGNKSSITRTVRIFDNTPPQITVQGDLVISIEFGAIFEDPGATALDDVDGEVTVTTSGSVNTNAIGTYTITYSAVDAAGNVSSTIRTVNVIDSLPPVITLVGDSVITVEYGSTFNDPGANAIDNVDNDITVTTMGTVDTFSVGTYTLTYTAEDSSGNITRAQRTVHVVDTIAPVISILGEKDVTVTFSKEYIDEGATATDNVDGNIAVTVSGEVDTYQLGWQTITYTATDSSGNSTTDYRNVQIIDLPPTIKLNGEYQVNIYLYQEYIESGVTVTDDVDDNIADSLVVESTLDTSVPGTYLITYTVTDQNNNVSTISRTVNVINPDSSLSLNDPDTTLYEANYKHKFHFTLNETLPVVRKLTYVVTDTSTASEGSDYNILNQESLIPSGSTKGFIEIEIIDDDNLEGSEYLDIVFLDSTGAEVHSLTITIEDETTTTYTHADIPQHILSPSVGVIDDTMWVLGGTSLDRYNLITETSNFSSSFFPSLGDYFGDAVVYDGQVYYYNSGTLYKVNQDTLEFEALSDSPTWLEWISELQVIDGELYVVAGNTQNEYASTIVQAYDIESGTWSTKANLKNKRYGASTAAINGKLYVFSGNYARGINEVYDPSTDTWDFIASNSQLGSSMDTAVTNGHIAQVTVSDNNNQTTMAKYDTELDTWQTYLLDFPAKTYLDSFLYKGRVYLVGGRDLQENSKRLISYYQGDDIN
ncbi:immunoglobulin-like domain-containing protein [Thalassotalea maritima]|uniref:immunoglobulin-like domain-containing protein n=1 Tax=Thalassotalea maritima TaxID=3242416 RepID=UPI0035273BC8